MTLNDRQDYLSVVSLFKLDLSYMPAAAGNISTKLSVVLSSTIGELLVLLLLLP